MAGINCTLDLDEWWGHESMKEHVTSSIREFRIHFDHEMKQDLIQRLKNHAPLTPPLRGAALTYGFTSNAVAEWVRYWTEDYNFDKREDFLNKYPQYKTNIQGLDIHFAWVKLRDQGSTVINATGNSKKQLSSSDKTSKSSKTVENVPLLLLHGWPGTFKDFYETIEKLTDVYAQSELDLELVVPSLPGFGYSDGAVRPGLGIEEIAIVLRNLMQRLGYHRYYIHGEDWGDYIGSHMACLFPEEVLGYHTNWGLVLTKEAFQKEMDASGNTSSIIIQKLALIQFPVDGHLPNLLEESGYLHINATKPDCIGIALSDSPVGLLAYTLDRISIATNRSNLHLDDGGLKMSFTPENLLDNAMIYWATRSITTSLRIYAETYNKRYYLSYFLEGKRTAVPTWIIRPKHEFACQPLAILKLKFANLLKVTPVDCGGHYFALECPAVLAESLVTAIREIRKLHSETERKKDENRC